MNYFNELNNINVNDRVDELHDIEADERMETSKNIFQRLSAITQELSTVAKKLEVGVGKSQYKAVGEADVLREVKPLEAKYGVYSYPFSRQIIESGTIENEKIDYQTKEKIVQKSLFERIETIYRFVNVDNPAEYVDITTYGDGIDTQDKSVGKAMTYGDKYALMKAYKIITGDDPDAKPSEALKSLQTKPAKPVSEETITKCNKLNIDLNNVAKYLKKPVEMLDDEEVKACVARKEKQNAKV